MRFYTPIDLLSGEGHQFGYQKSAGVYVPNTDTKVDNGEVYFALVDGEYVVVDEPKKADLASYYKMEELPGPALALQVQDQLVALLLGLLAGLCLDLVVGADRLSRYRVLVGKRDPPHFLRAALPYASGRVLELCHVHQLLLLQSLLAIWLPPTLPP